MVKDFNVNNANLLSAKLMNPRSKDVRLNFGLISSDGRSYAMRRKVPASALRLFRVGGMSVSDVLKESLKGFNRFNNLPRVSSVVAMANGIPVIDTFSKKTLAVDVLITA